MFRFCEQSVSYGRSTGFFKKILKKAEERNEKYIFLINGIGFSIFPNGEIRNNLGKRVKTVSSDGTVKNIED